MTTRENVFTFKELIFSRVAHASFYWLITYVKGATTIWNSLPLAVKTYRRLLVVFVLIVLNIGLTLPSLKLLYAILLRQRLGTWSGLALGKYVVQINMNSIGLPRHITAWRDMIRIIKVKFIFFICIFFYWNMWCTTNGPMRKLFATNKIVYYLLIMTFRYKKQQNN